MVENRYIIKNIDKVGSPFVIFDNIDKAVLNLNDHTILQIITNLLNTSNKINISDIDFEEINENLQTV